MLFHKEKYFLLLGVQLLLFSCGVNKSMGCLEMEGMVKNDQKYRANPVLFDPYL